LWEEAVFTKLQPYKNAEGWAQPVFEFNQAWKPGIFFSINKTNENGRQAKDGTGMFICIKDSTPIPIM
jgi:hypothetical protein